MELKRVLGCYDQKTDLLLVKNEIARSEQAVQQMILQIKSDTVVKQLEWQEDFKRQIEGKVNYAQVQEVVKGHDKAMMVRFASSEQVEHQEQQIKVIKKIVDETVSRESKFPLTVTCHFSVGAVQN